MCTVVYVFFHVQQLIPAIIASINIRNIIATLIFLRTSKYVSRCLIVPKVAVLDFSHSGEHKPVPCSAMIASSSTLKSFSTAKSEDTTIKMTVQTVIAQQEGIARPMPTPAVTVAGDCLFNKPKTPFRRTGTDAIRQKTAAA